MYTNAKEPFAIHFVKRTRPLTMKPTYLEPWERDSRSVLANGNSVHCAMFSDPIPRTKIDSQYGELGLIQVHERCRRQRR